MADKEYIERGAVLNPADILTVHTREYGSIDVIPVDCVSDIPAADVVEVVRCCDCKHCETVIHSIVDEPKWFCTRMVKAFDVDPSSFCSYGERKEQT